MRSCMFYFLAEASIRRSTLFIFCLSLRPFSVSVSEAAPPPFCILPRLAQLAVRPYYLFLQRCISTSWIFSFTSFSAMSDTEIYSRDPLLSWGSFFLCCLWRFQRSLWSGKRIFLIASAQAGVSVPYNLIRDLCIVAGFLSDLPIVWRCVFLGDLYRPKVLPGSWGISDVLGGTVLLSLACPGKSSPSLLLSSSLDE